MQERGKFIVFEGVGASGKGTQMEYARTLLEGNGYEVMMTREPGGTTGGEYIRQLIFNLRRNDLITPGEQMVLFFASRLLLIKEVIEPSCEKGITTLGDRFYTSTGAYQGYAEKGDMDKIHALIKVGLDGFKPDGVLYLDISRETALTRLSEEITENDDPFDRERADYFDRLIAGYRTMADEGWGGLNWYFVNGEPEIVEVSKSIKDNLEKILDTELRS